MFRKILILLLFSVVFAPERVIAGYHYIDGGGIFTNTTTPIDVAKAENGVTSTDLKKLKCGKSCARNILYLVEVGNAGIEEAAKKAGIKKISYVDMNEKTVFIFWRQLTINVYGE